MASSYEEKPLLARLLSDTNVSVALLGNQFCANQAKVTKGMIGRMDDMLKNESMPCWTLL